MYGLAQRHTTRRQVIAKRSTFVGLDVHKESIAVAIAESGRGGEVRTYGQVGGDLEALDTVRRALQAAGRTLHFVYEAGPCGFTIFRHLTAAGEDCAVVSPSLIPKRPGDRVKTDRRDAVMLARLHRAGELRPIYVPNEGDEALRDLVRTREDAVTVARDAKQRLKAFVLRHGLRYRGRAGWTLPYRRWLADLTMPEPAPQVALQEYLATVAEAEARVDRLTDQLRALVPLWRWAPVVEALQALRGVSFITATGLVAEIGDIRRFARAPELMAYLGLVPSERSSGPLTRRGRITKAGNSHARRLLAEAAWAYRSIPRIGRQMQQRQEHLPAAIRTLAWTAQLRLCGRFRRLNSRGKPRPVIATAIARELVGFVWAVAKEVPAGAYDDPARSDARAASLSGGEPSMTLWTSATADTSVPRAKTFRDALESGGTQPVNISRSTIARSRCRACVGSRGNGTEDDKQRPSGRRVKPILS